VGKERKETKQRMIPVTSSVQRLQKQLEVIEQKMMDLLDASVIDHFCDDPYSSFAVIAPPHSWGSTDEKQKRLQMEVLKLYKPWIEQVRLLFSGAPDEVSKEIEDADSFVIRWVERKDISWGVPASIEKAKSFFSQQIKPFIDLLQMLESPEQRRIIIVPDTNSLIMCPNFATYHKVAGQPEFTLVIMPTVLSELDNLKVTGRDQEFRNKVKSIITRIKGLRAQGSLLQGVTVNKTVTVRMEAREPDFEQTLSWLEQANNDDKLVASILELQRQEPSAVIILSTGDINLQNKAEMAYVPFVEPPDPD